MKKPVKIVDVPCENAENPLWHPQHQCLYWTDIPQGHLFRYDPKTKTYEQIYAGEPVGGMTIQADGSLLLLKARGAVEIWKEGKTTTVIPELPQEQDTRFNDAIADPKGRVFSGTMATDRHKGCLYRLETDGTITPVLEGVSVPNGMGFTLDRKQFYFTDSPARKIYRFDYDEETGNLSNQQIFITTSEEEGVPDGLTVDSEGYLWSARWDGGHLYRYTPDGEESLRIPFPVRKVTSVTFGSKDYTQIFVTTAGGNDRNSEGPGAGAVFQLDLGIKGLPEFFSRIGL